MSEAIMGRLSPDYTAEDRFNPDFLLGKFKRQFQFGRKTASTCEEHKNKLPSPNTGCFGEIGSRSVFDIFGRNLYGSILDSELKWRMIAAIMGAHTLGGSNINITGKTALWSDVHNQATFNNDFYKSMIQNGWEREKMVNEDLGITRMQWKRTGDIDKDSALPMFMLNTDICLAYNIHLNNGENCCAYMEPDLFLDIGRYTEFCGAPFKNLGERMPSFEDQCCKGTGPVCDNPEDPAGPAFEAVLDFANNEHHFFRDYLKAWKIATDVGHHSLRTPACNKVEEPESEEKECKCGKCGKCLSSLVLDLSGQELGSNNSINIEVCA
jgi:hypothetical protein